MNRPTEGEYSYSLSKTTPDRTSDMRFRDIGRLRTAKRKLVDPAKATSSSPVTFIDSRPHGRSKRTGSGLRKNRVGLSCFAMIRLRHLPSTHLPNADSERTGTSGEIWLKARNK